MEVGRPKRKLYYFSLFVHKFVFLSFTTSLNFWSPTPMKSIKLQIYQFRLSFNTYNPLHTLIYSQLKNQFVSIVNDTLITWKTQTSIGDAIKHKMQSLWERRLISHKQRSKGLSIGVGGRTFKESQHILCRIAYSK